MPNTDSKPKHTTEQAPQWVYMTLDKAVFILEDMTLGQLDCLDLRNFRNYPEAALVLIRAVQTVHEARFSGQGELNASGRWAYEMIISKQSTLESSRHDIKAYIKAALDGYMLDGDGEILPPDDYRTPNPPSVLRRYYNAVNGKARAGYVYVLRSPTGAYKIGLAQNPADRLRTFSVKLPFEVEYDTLIKTSDMRALEQELHARYADRHINGEWFALTENDLVELRAMGGAS